MKAALTTSWALSPSTLRREPTPVELAGGFICGGLDLQLMNELMFRLSLIQSEGADVVTFAGLSLNEVDRTQLRQAIVILAQNQVRALALATDIDVGSANSLAIAPTPEQLSYVNGQRYRIRKAALASSGQQSLSVNSLVAKPIIWPDGSLTSGGGAGGFELVGSTWLEVVYDANRDKFVRLTTLSPIQIKAMIAAEYRLRLPPLTTFYVNSISGDDVNNTGLTSISPFATLQGAATRILHTYDVSGFTVTLSVASGTYAPLFLDSSTALNLILQGNDAIPGSCVITSAGTAQACVSARAGGQVAVYGFRLLGPNQSLAANEGSGISFRNIEFATSNTHISAAFGGHVSAVGNYTILAGGTEHIRASATGTVSVQGRTVSIPATVGFSNSFAISGGNAFVAINTGTTFGGAAVTGQRFAAVNNGVIDTAGAGLNYLPGSVAGAETTGGRYV